MQDYKEFIAWKKGVELEVSREKARIRDAVLNDIRQCIKEFEFSFAAAAPVFLDTDLG